VTSGLLKTNVKFQIGECARKSSSVITIRIIIAKSRNYEEVQFLVIDKKKQAV